MRRVFMLLSVIVSAVSVPFTAGAQDIQIDYPRNLSEQVVNPTADATAMLRYQDCPVSYATGTADVTIPLLQYKYGELELSLAISYHTGGIKVDDPAGCIGLGWTLQGLGRVSRQICAMPDDSLVFVRTGELNDPTAKDYYDLMFYKRYDNPNSKEANYDRYNYDIPGYSGSFIVDGDSIVDFSQNGVKISCSITKNVPINISMLTPEGVKYKFGARNNIEKCTYKEKITDGFFREYDHDYANEPVTWMLTDIHHHNMSGLGGITIDYARSSCTGKVNTVRIPTVTRRWDCRSETMPTTTKTEGWGTQSTTTYTNRAIPSRICCFSDTVYFDLKTVDGSSEEDKRMISTIRVVNSQGREVRRISFDNSALFEDGRPRLDAMTVTSGGKTVDSRKFEYNSGPKSSYSDFFGYANGRQRNYGAYTQTYIIDPEKLTMNPDRASNSLYVCSWSLKKITDATGVETTFNYELNSCSSNGQTIYNGIRIGKIRSYDPITGRERTRAFQYSDPDMSLPLNSLSLRNFISLSGVRSYNGEKNEQNEVYSLSATFTASSNNVGVPAEKMRIYYGKVTETVTGTDMSPVRTDYEFDNSRCISSRIFYSPYRAENIRMYSSDMIVTGDRNRIKLGYYLGATGQEYYSEYDLYKVFGYMTETVNFDEIANPQPLLVKKISYEYNGGTYRPLETTEKFYSSHDRFSFPVGIFVQSNVYKTYDQNEYYHNIYDKDCPADTLTSTLHERCWVYSERIRHDSTAVTRHYPDGNTRTVWQRHYYNNLLSKIETALYENPDTILPAPSDTLTFEAVSLQPVSTITGCGSDYLIHNIIRVRNIKKGPKVTGNFYDAILDRNPGYIPVTDRWIVRSGTMTDSLSLKRAFAGFAHNSTIQPKFVTLGREASQNIAWQKFHDYNSRGNVTSMTGSDGLQKTYTWDATGFLLTSKNIAGLKSDYTWEPLVGCTSIATPSGRKHTFSYSGGRLASERNTAGDTVATYSYSLYADTGANITEASVRNDKGAATTRVWYDGFGLPVQSVAAGAGANSSQDVCSFTEYDGLDRPVRQWQPVPVSGTDSIYTDTELRSFASSVYGADSRPFTSTDYLASAGEKVAAVYLPGDALADHPAQTSYLCNDPAKPELKVRRILVDKAMTTLTVIGYYKAGVFDAVKTVDPDGHTIITFTDWRGFKVLERRVLANNDFLDTYYVNDVWGEPLIVLQPELSALYKDRNGVIKLDSDNAKKYTFQYRYDRCGRLVSKKIPGCEPVTYRYDPYGRLAFMQDGNMRAAGRAMFTLYDEFSRVAVTGMCDDDAMAGSVTIPSMTAVLDETAIGICGTGYLISILELLQNAELLTAAYYDDYDFLMLDAFSALPQETTSSYASAKGLATGTLTAVLGSDSGKAPIAAVTYYDNEERPVKTLSTTHIAGSNEQTVTTYTLDGQPKTVSHTLKHQDDTYADSYEYSYDRAGRLAAVKASWPWANLTDMDIVSDTYNSIGQLIKSVSGGSTTTYSYDIRGAVSSLQNSAVNQSITRNANGTISKIIDNGITHTFEYDNVGRLLSETCDNTTSTTGIFSSAYTYDRNSNITTLTRKGYPAGMSYPSNPVDDLTMTYDGNRLIKVTDNAGEVLLEKTFDFHDGANNATEYTYDSNGNVTRDDNRGMTDIAYNALNLPSHIEVGSDAASEAIVDYIYDAAGNKLGTRSLISYFSTRPLTTYAIQQPCRAEDHDYIGSYEFRNGQLHRVNTPYGYITMGTFIPYRRDYQGNNRNNADYYAYGLPVQGSEVKDPDPYLYSGKEFYSLSGINIYDFNARTYAPDIARFMQPDPLATENHGVSPYIYCLSDPINFIDPTGEKVYYVDMTGRLISSEEAGTYNSLNMKEVEAQYEGLDVVLIIDKDGKIIRQSETFDEGTIVLHDNNQSDLKGKDITLFEITGEEAGKSVFETLSRAITARNGIEFGYIMKGSSKKGSNFVFTDHNVAKLESMNDVFYYAFNADKQPFKSIIHSHMRTPDPSKPDIDSRNGINSYLTKANRTLPEFMLYISDVPLYINYTKY